MNKFKDFELDLKVEKIKSKVNLRTTYPSLEMTCGNECGPSRGTCPTINPTLSDGCPTRKCSKHCTLSLDCSPGDMTTNCAVLREAGIEIVRC